MKERRNVRMNLYFSQNEIDQIAKNSRTELPIEGQAKQKRLAAFVRSTALGKETKTVSPIAQDQFRELARLSSNLNQISHRINGGYKPDIEEVKELTNQIRLKLLGIQDES